MARVVIIVIVMLFTGACQKEETPDPVIEAPVGKLELIDSYPIDVPEPSGLSFGPDKKTLLTVSDHTNQVYEMDMQGNIIRMLNYTGKNLEGVTYNPDKNLVVVAEETDREITFIDYDTGIKVETFWLDIPANSDNNGLEGISYNTNNKLYYIVNEMNPELLITWNEVSGIVSEENLDFASDYSGIFTDADHSLLWFVSDQSKRVFMCDYNANVLQIFNLDELKYEGIVVDDNIICLVNDATAKLEYYQIIKNELW